MKNGKNTMNIIRSLMLVVIAMPGISYSVEIEKYPVLVELIKTMSAQDNYPAKELTEIISSAKINQKTLQLMDKQWEAQPWHKYRKIFINENRITRGVEFWDRYEPILSRAENEYGVPAEIIVAIIGVETHYGTRTGTNRVLDSLVTLSAAYPRRSKFFKAELRVFLNVTRNENIDPASVTGSFAGAIGIPQFMPSSYKAYSVDFNRNGKRDLANEFEDAIGSVANYLKVHGWKAEQSIYSRVLEELPSDALHLVSKKAKLSHSRDLLLQKGVKFNSQTSSDKVALISLSEELGERYFVGFKNFYAITRYNSSINYSMAVTELSEAIRKQR